MDTRLSQPKSPAISCTPPTYLDTKPGRCPATLFAGGMLGGRGGVREGRTSLTLSLPGHRGFFRYSVYRKAQREAEQQRAEEQAQVQAGGAGMAEILGNLAGRVKEAVLVGRPRASIITRFNRRILTPSRDGRCPDCFLICIGEPLAGL